MITTIRLAARTAFRPICSQLNLLPAKKRSLARLRHHPFNTVFIRNACNSENNCGKKSKPDCCNNTSKNKTTKKSSSLCGGKGDEKVNPPNKGKPAFCGNKKEDDVEVKKDEDICPKKKVSCSDSHEKFKQDVEEKEEAADECSESEESTSSSESDELKDECPENDEKETEEKECSEESEESEEDKPAKDDKAAASLCDCTTAALAKGIVDTGKEAVMKKVCGKKPQEASNQCQKALKETKKVENNMQCCQVETAGSKLDTESDKSSVEKCKKKVKDSKKKKIESTKSTNKKDGGSTEAKKMEEQCNCIRKALEKCNAPGTNIPAKPTKTPDEKKDTEKENKPIDKEEEETKPEKEVPNNEREKGKDKGVGQEKKPDEKETTGTKICNATRVGKKKRPVTKVCK